MYRLSQGAAMNAQGHPRAVPLRHGRSDTGARSTLAAALGADEAYRQRAQVRGAGEGDKQMKLNVGRGLFRAWIFLTVVWLIAAGTGGYFIIGNEVDQWKWQYVDQVHPGANMIDVFTRPYYENMYSPSAEKLAVTFVELYYESIPRWNEQVKEGSVERRVMPDHSALYLDKELTRADREYLVNAFWAQRRWRYVRSFAKIWVPIVVMPVVLFIFGWAFLWIGRGFRTA